MGFFDIVGKLVKTIASNTKKVFEKVMRPPKPDVEFDRKPTFDPSEEFEKENPLFNPVVKKLLETAEKVIEKAKEIAVTVLDCVKNPSKCVKDVLPIKK